MTHYIIVKFVNTVSDKEKLVNQITTLFSQAAKIPGIHQVQIYSSCIDKANRHDLMIKMELESDSLEIFDSSAIHQEWKETFGSYLAAKTIFDCE